MGNLALKKLDQPDCLEEYVDHQSTHT